MSHLSFWIVCPFLEQDHNSHSNDVERRGVLLATLGHDLGCPEADGVQFTDLQGGIRASSTETWERQGEHGPGIDLATWREATRFFLVRHIVKYLLDPKRIGWEGET